MYIRGKGQGQIDTAFLVFAVENIQSFEFIFSCMGIREAHTGDVFEIDCGITTVLIGVLNLVLCNKIGLLGLQKGRLERVSFGAAAHFNISMGILPGS